MNEALKEKAMQALSELLNLALQAKDFAVEQTPDVVRQLLIWNGKYLGQRRVHDDAGNTLEMSQLTATQKLAAIMRFSAGSKSSSSSLSPE